MPASVQRQAELCVSRLPGVTSAITTSLALGGVSVMRVDLSTAIRSAFRAALAARGLAGRRSGTGAEDLRADGGGQTMSQIALPLAWPAADSEEDFLVSDANRAAVRPSRTLVALAGDGDAADRPAQVRPQPARPHLRRARPAAS